MLEKMDEFFNNRLDGYDEHQLNVIDDAKSFYPFTAKCLPQTSEAEVLDLGCGSGLELGYYFNLNSSARITGIDLSEGMLSALREKFPNKPITLLQGSYFDVPFGNSCYDAVVSVESLHHFTKDEKKPLYEKIRRALKKDGYFILTDYFASSEEEEVRCRQELNRLRCQQKIEEGVFYHYDTPLTVEHEIEALLAAGFSSIKVIGKWGATCTLRAEK